MRRSGWRRVRGGRSERRSGPGCGQATCRPWSGSHQAPAHGWRRSAAGRGCACLGSRRAPGCVAKGITDRSGASRGVCRRSPMGCRPRGPPAGMVQASGPSGTARPRVSASGSSMQPSFTCSRRRSRTSDIRQPVSNGRRKTATAEGISSSASRNTSPNRAVSSDDRKRSRRRSLPRLTCRQGLDPPARQPRTSARENIFESTPRVRLA